MKVHFIAMGGSAMHNLAIALHKKGITVTGSDDVFTEPSKSRLDRFGLLPANQGWDAERITNDLDAVILGMHAKADNPELLEAQQKGIRIFSYPEYVYEQSCNKTRVVIGGSHGKTTITSMILHVLKEASVDFDYLVGAQLEGFDTMVKITEEAPLIVIEGDEYLSSPIDRRPKFHLYKANIGLISGIAWDHINVFPTFDIYLDQFALFIDTISEDGKLIYCEQDEVLKKLVETHPAAVEKIAYHLPSFKINNGVTSLVYQGQAYPLQVFGDHNLLNIEAAKAVCTALNIEEETFYKAISSFKGAAKRLELIGSNAETNVYKDFAHSPSKLSATINAVKNQFPDRKLIACIELHTFSSLNKAFLQEYAGTMDTATDAIVFIDKHTFEQKNMEPYTAQEVKEAFAKEGLLFFDDPKLLFRYLKQLNYKESNLLLMSSGTFAGTDLASFTESIL
ncbi:UDP-N-acetylmuramate--L-alanine ligase [Mucilaginibacter arboris]|uniref:Peptidoglycan synthetase n=1 Tax=Mucilaginibacter arboris TaxID=2682090 RepID=A0A7K1SYE6_9SPHI|nr:Mur ligase family protein [Mucilaginibacter arboris]MVN22344.1 peptidoglycan synthetase [Mucilaginibacter arboris]